FEPADVVDDFTSDLGSIGDKKTILFGVEHVDDLAPPGHEFLEGPCLFVGERPAVGADALSKQRKNAGV
ncbi:MAG: hypothetical protein ABIS92_11775, partial [Polyangia bacterium]